MAPAEIRVVALLNRSKMSVAVSVSSATIFSSVVKKAWAPSADTALKAASCAPAEVGTANSASAEIAKPKRIILITPLPKE